MTAPSERNLKQTDLSQVQVECERIQLCLQKFPTLQQRVEGQQLNSIQLKYQYFLRKFNKYLEEHKKYKTMFQNIQNTIEESSQIKEENRSIDFIKKIMEDTEKKYNVMKSNIDDLRTQKQKTQNKMVKLKNILLKIKREYFQLQRKGEDMTEKIQEQVQYRRSNQIHKTMFKIRVQKKMNKDDLNKIKEIPYDKLQTNSSFIDRKITEELQSINRLKQQFLETIGINITEFYKINERSYDLQSKYNRHKLKKDIELKQNSKLKTIQSYIPGQNAVEVFKIVKDYDHNLQEFMNLDGNEIIDLIIKKNKVGDILQMIQEEKRNIVNQFKQQKMARYRITN